MTERQQVTVDVSDPIIFMLTVFVIFDVAVLLLLVFLFLYSL